MQVLILFGSTNLLDTQSCQMTVGVVYPYITDTIRSESFVTKLFGSIKASVYIYIYIYIYICRNGFIGKGKHRE